MMRSILALAWLLGCAAAAVLDRAVAVVCPQLHIMAARETTAPPGFGSAKTLVDLVLDNFPGATSEEIQYPAIGGDDYAKSVRMGIVGVISQLAMFTLLCPDTVLIMHGYSQGGQIIDDSFCGGPDGRSLRTTGSLVPVETGSKVAAIIMMGNPRHRSGQPFNVGNATGPGFAARPANFSCPVYQDRMQSYCDSPDPFCSNGTDAAFHQGYGERNGQQALQFILNKLPDKARVIQIPRPANNTLVDQK
ncbi:uncharacterized protein E0L32_009011 [Thyridium curvatum]|uniref:Uncharacterized protein n=1 Tax=Thyridium curvatum TaxID=1093900 RepID=A0A507AZY8_9PEZI|nr:uncharacterized protein E0L32_009011 [Thyridium curvatum]TPX09820.1 hypothetical protein E0L32_009011 [Thyridium curvatum]